MNRRLLSLTLIASILIPASNLLAQETRVSPHETISTVVEATGKAGLRLMIIYGRPYTKAPRSGEMRKIWGGLVPFGKVWRTGADEATTLITPVAIEMGGVTIPAGTYTLWTLPNADGSAKLIINKDFGIWGESYDEKQDLARIDLAKTALDKSVDQFTMALDGNPGSGYTLSLAWELTKYSVPFVVKK